MLENIEVLCHSCIKINKGKIIYFDPFGIEEYYNDADIIFITHSHYDHYSEEDIEKVKKDKTKIVVTIDLKDKVHLLGFDERDIVIVNPGEDYEIDNVKFMTIPAYNIDKQFHPKENNWVGYIVELNKVKYYVAGDTDITEENKKVECDVAFVPVGGTYTMTAKEAANLVNEIEPKFAIPIHYGRIVGSEQDALEFIRNVDMSIKTKKMI